MKTIEYQITSIVTVLMMEFTHVQERLRIVMEHLSHPVLNIFQSQVPSLKTKKVCLLNLFKLDNLEVQLDTF